LVLHQKEDKNDYNLNLHIIMKKVLENPYILFSPFLVFSIAIVFLYPTHGTFGDENRYLFFASNLIHGYYSPPAPDIELGNGPGYSLILAPLVALKLPLTCITLFNAFLHYFSIILFYKTLRIFLSLKYTLIFSIFWGCYANTYENIPIIHNEILAIFLIISIIYSLIKSYRQENGKRYLILAGFLIGYLILTKPIFSYVLFFMLIGNLLFLLIIKKKENLTKGFIALITAFITILPYSVYTYAITGRIFYFSTNGGDTLYWMSTPFEKEYGSWYPFHFSLDSNAIKNHDLIPGGEELIKSNHRKSFEIIFSYKGIERDDELKKIAIENIKTHPLKFIKNCFCNIGRIIFNFPYSYTAQKPATLLRLPFNGIISVFILLCFIPTVINWRRIFFPIRFLLIFSLFYFFGSILGSAETRMFTLIVPILLFWIAYILNKTVLINIKFD